MSSADSRRAFLKKMASFAVSATFVYEKPEVKFLSLAQLDANDPNAKSFEDVNKYNHSGIFLPSKTEDPSKYWHIFTKAHGIEDDEYWGSKLLEMVHDPRNFLGETLRGKSGTTSQRMILGYESLLSGGRQLWAYVEKVSGKIIDGGINVERKLWDPSHGFVEQAEEFMNRAELTYRLMWKTIETGAYKQKTRFFAEDGGYTAVAWFMFFGELGVTWTNGASVDPTIYEGFEEKMSEAGLLDNANATEALAFVKSYLLEQAPLFDCTGEDPADALLDIFEKELTDEEWEAKYNELTKGLAVL